jgi:hypothetical protein
MGMLNDSVINKTFNDLVSYHADLMSYDPDTDEIANIIATHDVILLIWNRSGDWAESPLNFASLVIQGGNKYVPPTVRVTLVPVRNEEAAHLIRDMYAAPETPAMPSSEKPKAALRLVWDAENK